MSKYDTIEEVEVAKYNPYHDEKGRITKSHDEIVEVEKFNPFHDSRGRFSNKNGFASYSANPNTKAGAMAIARSAAAGHGNTANVHRESYGENIRQNANWIGQGKQQTPRQQGTGTLRYRVEPAAGLAGASAAGASWQYQNQQQGRTTKPGKKTTQQPQQAANQQQSQQQAATKPQQTQQKPAAKPQQQQTQQQQANARTPVTGKDISRTFKYDARAKGDPLDQVADQQGFKGKPTLIKDRAQFSAAVKDSGVMAYRTLGNGQDVVTGKTKTGAQFADDLKNSDSFSHNGTGGKIYGSGIYIAATSNPVQGKAPSRQSTNNAKSDSQGYGWSGGAKTVAMTLDKSAKIGDYSKVRSDYNNLTRTKRAQYGDLAGYAASKGYDGLKAVNAGMGCDYITVYNRTKLIIFDD